MLLLHSAGANVCVCDKQHGYVYEVCAHFVFHIAFHLDTGMCWVLYSSLHWNREGRTMLHVVTCMCIMCGHVRTLITIPSTPSIHTLAEGLGTVSADIPHD